MKLILKKLLVPLLASRPVTSLASRFLENSIPIFFLHRISPEGHPDNRHTNPEHLRRCLQYLLENGHNIISLEELVSALRDRRELPPKSVVFTIDDGYLDQAKIAAPIFIEFGAPLTFFVITGMLNGDLWPWDAKVAWIIETTDSDTLKFSIGGNLLELPLDTSTHRRSAKHILQNLIKNTDADLVPDILDKLSRTADVHIPEFAPEPYQPMRWDDARELEKQGIGFAPHSISHNILSRLSCDRLAEEIDGAWRHMVSELSRPLKIFCYPTGRPIDYGVREVRALERSGFLGATAAIPGFVEPHSDINRQIFNLPRFSLPSSMDDFIQCCSWIEYAKNTWRKRPSSPISH